MSETQPLINSHDFPPCYQGRAPVRTRWLGRLSAALMVALTFLWVFRYLGGVGLSPTVTGPGVNTTDVIFNWHPLLMCIAFPVLMGEALIAYKAPLCFADKAPRYGYLSCCVIPPVRRVRLAGTIIDQCGTKGCGGPTGEGPEG